MRRFLHTAVAGLLFLCSALTAHCACAADQLEQANKTLSPYFFIKSDDPSVDQMPLQSTSAQVNIAGVIADVRVTQVYKNEGKKPLEALYVFPASTRAAVYGMKMTIGERTITAQIREREEARREYETAKQEGKSASLLEEQRPNVFQMNVANILPGDIIRVELSYTEFLSPTDGVYEFVYPTVVGPRYTRPSESPAPLTSSSSSSSSEKWVANPYLHQGEPAPYAFDMQVSLSTGLPLQEVTCPSHKVSIRYESPSLAVIQPANEEKSSGNRDFIVRYKLAGEKIASGLLLYKGEAENFFLLMVQPPKRITPDAIPPREYIFIVDVSGSMHGFPLDISKQLMKDLLSHLRPADRFNVLLFAGGSSLLSEKSLPATEENIGRALQVISEERGGGGTELLPALQRTLALPKSEGHSRSIVIATDGFVNVETESFDLIRNSLGKANLFAFGIGTSVNRFIIEGMARAGMGEPFVVTKPEQAAGQAEKFRKYIEAPLLTEIRMDTGGFQAYEVEPPAIPDVLAERPVTVFGKWRGDPRGRITLEGHAGKQKFSQAVDVGAVQPLDVNAPLRYLWARQRIATLADYNRIHPDDGRVAAVRELGLQYHLLTAYTSFVAVDTLVRRTGEPGTTVQQPLPLPEGVSDLALGRGMQVAAPRSLLSMEKTPPTPHGGKETLKGEENEGMPDPGRGSVHEVNEEMTLSGGLSREAVVETVRQHLPEVEKCYEIALQRDPSLKGGMILKFVLDAKGTVQKVQIISSEMASTDLEACLKERLKAWKFPSLTEGNTAEVTYPFTFGLP